MVHTLGMEVLVDLLLQSSVGPNVVHPTSLELQRPVPVWLLHRPSRVEFEDDDAHHKARFESAKKFTEVIWEHYVEVVLPAMFTHLQVHTYGRTEH